MDFFKTEQKLLDRAEIFMEGDFNPDTSIKEEYTQLYKGFKKLLKESKKLITLSDSTQKKLKESNDQLKMAEERLLELSITDTLTGLLNRRGVYQWLESELVRVRRNRISLAIFKRVNDTYGHLAGDRVLQELANLFNDSLREQDCIGRWGGEEFLLALPNTDEDGAYLLGDKLRKKVEDRMILYDNKIIDVTISLGACCLNEDLTLDSCLSCADKALYRSKNEGRNRVTINEY